MIGQKGLMKSSESSLILLNAGTAQRPFSQGVYLTKFYLKLAFGSYELWTKWRYQGPSCGCEFESSQGLSLPEGSGGV